MEREELVRGVGGVVLAAGAAGAHRHVHAGAEPRIRHAARSALDAGLWPVVVVVGDPGDGVREALAGLPVATVANEAFAEGEAGSLRLGLARVAECAPSARGVVVMAAEPRVGAEHLRALAAAALPKRGALAASSRNGHPGLPAFFPAALFAELCALHDEESCAELLERHVAELVALE